MKTDEGLRDAIAIGVLHALLNSPEGVEERVQELTDDLPAADPPTYQSRADFIGIAAYRIADGMLRARARKDST